MGNQYKYYLRVFFVEGLLGSFLPLSVHLFPRHRCVYPFGGDVAGPFFVSDKLLKIFLVITVMPKLGLGSAKGNTRRVNDGELLESPRWIGYHEEEL